MNTQTSLVATSTNRKTLLNKLQSQNSDVYEKLCKKEAKLALVGLGYVGLPIALEFAKSFEVIGYDINQSRIKMMKNGIDPSGELNKKAFENKDIFFTSHSETLDNADVMVVAVPTPVSKDKTPDLNPLSSACRALGASIGKGNIIIFESTVYPGCTEEVCIPILEKVSGLKSQDQIYKIYDHIIEAGVHIAPNMKVAEAAKIVENTQRDVNIALMNELSTLFDVLKINTHEVLEAAGTKWNFLNFYPGLVGGHCIGVDPYYLIHKATSMGMNLDVIQSSRSINDGMPQHIVDTVSDSLLKMDKKLSNAKVLVLGATFKENVTDLRNSKAAEMSQILYSEAKELHIIDPMADTEEMLNYYGLNMQEEIEMAYDVIIYAVNHKDFEHINWEFINRIKSNKTVVFDFKKLLGYPTDNHSIQYLTL